MSAAVTGTGTGTSASPPPQRTIISHRELADAADDFSDAPEVTERGGHDDSMLTPNGAKSHNEDGMIENADEVFQRAASATPVPAKTTGKKSRNTTPKSPKTSTSKAAKPAKATKEAKSTAAISKDKVEFAGEMGPDNSVTVDGEQLWEISDIVGQEGDVLLVKWKGWKGVWEEDHAVIAESAPELVQKWEAKVEAAGKEKAKAGQKKRGRPAGKKNGGVGVKEPTTAGKVAVKGNGGKGQAKDVVLKNPWKKVDAVLKNPRMKADVVPKDTKKTAAAVPESPKKPAKHAVLKNPRKKPDPVPESPKKPAKTSTKEPKKKVGPTASPKKATSSPKKNAAKTTATKGKASGSGAGAGAGALKKRGRPRMKVKK